MSRVVTAHSMNAATGRSRGRTNIKSWDGRSIRDGAQDRPRQRLPKISQSAVDVAADQVWIFVLHHPAILGRPGQNTVAKTGREPLHLLFDAVSHIDRRTVRDVAVGPRRVLPLRGAAVI